MQTFLFIMRGMHAALIIATAAGAYVFYVSETEKLISHSISFSLSGLSAGFLILAHHLPSRTEKYSRHERPENINPAPYFKVKFFQWMMVASVVIVNGALFQASNGHIIFAVMAGISLAFMIFTGASRLDFMQTLGLNDGQLKMLEAYLRSLQESERENYSEYDEEDPDFDYSDEESELQKDFDSDEYQSKRTGHNLSKRKRQEIEKPGHRIDPFDGIG